MRRAAIAIPRVARRGVATMLIAFAGVRYVANGSRLCKNADVYGWAGAPINLRGSSQARIASINPPTPRILITRFIL